MQIFKRILCPIDFSEFSALALKYASALARENDAQLVVYHSIPDLTQMLSHLEATYIGMMDEVTSNASERLEKYIRSVIPADQEVLERIEMGSAADGILNLVKGGDIDLIVMGTHGYTGYERFFVGSITNKILHKSQIPVLAVCKPAHDFFTADPGHAIEIKKILCPLDLELKNLPLTSLALSLARQYRSTIYFLYSVERTDSRSSWSEMEQLYLEALRKLVPPEKEDWCEARLLVRRGEPIRSILSVVEQENIDLLVMGHQARKPIEELFLGSVAKRMVTDSPCPVLVVHAEHKTESEVIIL